MYEVKRTIGHSCMGIDGQVRTGAMLDLIQDCNLYHIQSQKVISDMFSSLNSAMFVLYRQIEINGRPKYKDEVTVRTWGYRVEGLYGYRNTAILDEDDNMLMVTYEIGVFVKLENGRPFKAAKDLVAQMEYEPPYEGMIYKERKITLPEIEGIEVDQIRIFGYHCDNYKHVNNVRYVDITEEYLPEGFEIGELRIEFKSALTKGMEAKVVVYDMGDVFVVHLVGLDGKSHAIVEYTRK